VIFKKCTKCNIEKSLDCFYKDSSSKDGYYSSCKKCCKQIKRECYKKYYEKRINLKKCPPKNGLKICALCHEEKSLEVFWKNNFYSDGYNDRCKECEKIRYKNNHSEVEFQVCNKCEENKSVDNYHNDSSRKNGKYVYCKSCVKKSLDVNARNKRQREWYRRNRKEIIEKSKQWANDNKEKRRHISREYRARRIGWIGDEHIEYDKWLDLCKKYNNKCLRCGKSSDNLTQDHIVPLSKGGRHIIENIQPLCFSCNSSKNAKIIDYRVECI